MVDSNFGRVINPNLKPVAIHNNDANDDFPVVIDDFTISEFLCGNCGYLAIALHEATGWAIFEEYELNDDFTFDKYNHVHAWVKNDKGNAVDILGEHHGNWGATKHSKNDDKRVIVHSNIIDPDWYKKKINKDSEELRWARAIVKKFPSYFCI